MSEKRKIGSQITNVKTYQMYKRQFRTLAENVFEFDKMPTYIDIQFVNSTLVLKGAIAFFKDEILDRLVALPFTTIGPVDIYNRPTTIEVYAPNGFRRVLNPDEYVIMYDNNGMYPLMLDIVQYAERIANATRTIDVNLSQQKTPRFIKTNENKKLSTLRMLDNISENQEAILTYDDSYTDESDVILAPAPFVSGNVQEIKEKIRAEFLALIGISNLSFEKKERNITDEIEAMQGGTIASRFSRFEPRKHAVDLINEKFPEFFKEGKLSVRYYDGEPDSNESNNTLKEGETNETNKEERI